MIGVGITTRLECDRVSRDAKTGMGDIGGKIGVMENKEEEEKEGEE